MFAHQRTAKWLAACLSLLALMQTPAEAQSIGQEALSYLGTYAFSDSLHTWDQNKEFSAETVLDHSRDGFVPDGYVLPAGHMFYPSIGAKSVYDDNLFLQPGAGKIGDIRESVSPGFLWQAALPRHMFQIEADGDVVRFQNHPNLNFVNANVKADWHLDIDAADTVGGTFQARYGHDENFLPIDPADPAVALPNLSTRAAVGYSHEAGRTGLTVGADWGKNTYADVQSYGGDTLDEAANDNTIVGAFSLLSYRWSPGYRAFLAGRIDRELLTYARSAYANNTSYRGEMGVVYEMDPLLQFTLYAGYQYIKFDDPSQYNISTPTYKIAAQWLPTRRMTVTFDAGQQVSQTVQGYIFGELSSQAHGRVQYDIWHNIVGTIDGTYETDQYIGSTRLDHQWSATAGLDYLLNENVALTLSYQHTERASNEDKYDYNDNRYLLALKFSK